MTSADEDPKPGCSEVRCGYIVVWVWRFVAQPSSFQLMSGGILVVMTQVEGGKGFDP